MKLEDIRKYEGLFYVSQLGLIMIVPIFGGVVIGQWLDQRFHTGGILLLIMVVLCTMSGFLNVYRFVMRQIKKNERRY